RRVASGTSAAEGLVVMILPDGLARAPWCLLLGESLSPHNNNFNDSPVLTLSRPSRGPSASNDAAQDGARRPGAFVGTPMSPKPHPASPRDPRNWFPNLATWAPLRVCLAASDLAEVSSTASRRPAMCRTCHSVQHMRFSLLVPAVVSHPYSVRR